MEERRNIEHSTSNIQHRIGEMEDEEAPDKATDEVWGGWRDGGMNIEYRTSKFGGEERRGKFGIPRPTRDSRRSLLGGWDWESDELLSRGPQGGNAESA